MTQDRSTYALKVILQGSHNDIPSSISLVRRECNDNYMEVYVDDKLSNMLQSMLVKAMVKNHTGKLKLVDVDNPLPGDTVAYVRAISNLHYFDNNEYDAIYVFGDKLLHPLIRKKSVNITNR